MREISWIYRALGVAIAITSVAVAAGQSTDDDASLPVTVSVFFVDRIEENNSIVPGRRTERTEESWVAQQFKEKLLELDDRFEVIVNKQHEFLKRMHGDFAKLDGQDQKVLLEIAVDQGADYYLVGYAHVIGPKLNTRYIPGEKYWVWTAFAKAEIYSTDRGKVLATLDQEAVQGNLDKHVGRIRALRQAGNLLAPKFVKKLTKRQDKLKSGRVVVVTVLGCDPAQNVLIKKRLAKLIGKRIKASYRHEVFTARMKTTKPADELAAEIFSQKFDGFKLILDEARGDSLKFRLEPR